MSDQIQFSSVCNKESAFCDTKEGETISFYFVIDCEQVLKQGLERKSRELSSTQIKAIKQYDNLFAKLFL